MRPVTEEHDGRLLPCTRGMESVKRPQARYPDLRILTLAPASSRPKAVTDRRLPAYSGATVPDFHRTSRACDLLWRTATEARLPCAAQFRSVPLTFITGPVRSGKSRLALKTARARESHGARVTYVATATLGEGDPEWRDRIDHHRDERDPAWRVVETAAPGAPSLAELISSSTREDVLIVDSTATWLAAAIDRRLASGRPIDEGALEAECAALVDACEHAHAFVVIVGDEIGWGIVPHDAATRTFRDVIGRLQQRLASVAERAFLAVAGRAIDLYEYGTTI